jgi:hypothetical protein
MILGFAVAALAVGIALITHTGPASTGQAPATANSTEAVSVPISEVVHGIHSTVSKRANYLITSQTGFLALWALIDAGTQPPNIDFSKNDIIAVFTGDEPTAGFDITVSQVEDSQSRMVTVLVTKPGSSCLPKESSTSPYQIIELPKTTLPLSHQDQEHTTSCLQ